MSKTEPKRRMSLEEDFMNHYVNDILFSYMACLATFDGERLYLSKLKFKERERQILISKILGVSTRTVYRYLDKLLEKGLIEDNGDKYYFPYDFSKKYELIDLRMLEYLVATGSRFLITVYTYLFSKHKFKNDYVFTKKELLQVCLGYEETTAGNNQYLYQIINDVLECLKRQGILETETVYIQKMVEYEIVEFPAMKIKKFITKKDDLPDLLDDKISELFH